MEELICNLQKKLKYMIIKKRRKKESRLLLNNFLRKKEIAEPYAKHKLRKLKNKMKINQIQNIFYTCVYTCVCVLKLC